MNRRKLLAVVGTGVVGGVAGCLNSGSQSTPSDSREMRRDHGGTSPSLNSGSQSTPSDSGAPFEHPGTLEATFAVNGDYPDDEDPADGLPPEFSGSTAAPNVDPSSFGTINTNGQTVRLAPIDVVEAWYRRGETRFVDARGLGQYERSHVYGAVASPAQQDSTGGGLGGWSTDARIITYCGCPHHLSSIRAAGLQKSGYSNVFAIDEGFDAWKGRGYPMGGTTFTDGTKSNLSEWRLDGVVEAATPGAYAWASAGRQYEAAPIQPDGSFTIHLKFADVDAETPIEVSTPDYTLTRPLGELVDGTIER